jgi:sugar (pentulose or hexulose) kinase
VTCSGLAQQLAADSVAGGCTAGPVANVASDGGGATTVHFVCSGGHDAVVAAIAVISRDLAAVTLSGALD